MRFVAEIAQELVERFFVALRDQNDRGIMELMDADGSYRHWDGSLLGRQALVQACMQGHIRVGGVRLLDAVTSARCDQARSAIRIQASGRFFGETIDEVQMGMRVSFVRASARQWVISHVECLRGSDDFLLPADPGERAEYGFGLWGAARFEGLFSDFADASHSLAQVLFSHNAVEKASDAADLDCVDSDDAQAVLQALDWAARSSLGAVSEENPLVSAALQESGLMQAEGASKQLVAASKAAEPPRAPKLSAQQRSFIDSALQEVGQAIGADLSEKPAVGLAPASSNPAFSSAQDDAVSQALAAALAAEALGDDESGLTQSSGGFLLL